jgi:hypothetical protein
VVAATKPTQRLKVMTIRMITITIMGTIMAIITITITGMTMSLIIMIIRTPAICISAKGRRERMCRG